MESILIWVTIFWRSVTLVQAKFYTIPKHRNSYPFGWEYVDFVFLTGMRLIVLKRVEFKGIYKIST